MVELTKVINELKDVLIQQVIYYWSLYFHITISHYVSHICSFFYSKAYVFVFAGERDCLPQKYNL